MTDSNILEIDFHEVTTGNELFCQFDDHHGVLLIDVKKPFSQDDFETISAIVDPYFAEHGPLKGVIVNAKKFPHWTCARNRQEYIDFAGNNHHKFERAAFAMGGFFTKIIIRMARGRVYPTVKLFKHNQIHHAQNWILQKGLSYFAKL